VQETALVIWLSGSRFRVSDAAGRPYREVVADAVAPRGFGSPPRTMEDFMDAFDASVDDSDLGPTELWGDVATGEGSVRQPRGEPWPVDASRLAPVAEQVLSDGHDEGDVTYVQEGEEDGRPYRSDVRLSVKPPFVVRREVRDAANPELSAVTEVVELEEGTVTDADLSPPVSDT
jgi:hypothetical protein